MIIAVSFASSDILGQPVFGFRLDAYRLIFETGLEAPFFRSIGYALATTAICLVLGYVVAYTLARFGGRYRNVFLLLALVPWFVDYLVRIYSWIQLVGDNGLLTSVLHFFGGTGTVDLLGHSYSVIGGLVYNFLPYMILALYVSIDQIDSSLIEAGRDLYGSPIVTLVTVTIPNTLPGILSGCLLVFMPAIGDFATAQLLGSPQQYMIGNLISSELQTPGALPIGSALSAILLAFLGIVAAVGVLALSLSRRRREALRVA
jgi:spermidine/putrescine transport system permease protein